MRVIAKAYEGEPLDRVVAGEEGSTLFLVNPNVNRTAEELVQAGVGFPQAFVFRFSDSLWNRLAGAWVRRDNAELEELWAGAEHI